MLRKQTSEIDPADWFAFAGERLRGADVLWHHEGLTGLGIEALQEAAERYLKGFLIAKGWQLVRTHDLEVLIQEAIKLDPAFGRFIPMSTQLTEDFFAQHYPGEDMLHVGDNYESLRKQVEEMLELIKSNLPQYFPKSLSPHA